MYSLGNAYKLVQQDNFRVRYLIKCFGPLLTMTRTLFVVMNTRRKMDLPGLQMLSKYETNFTFA